MYTAERTAINHTGKANGGMKGGGEVRSATSVFSEQHTLKFTDTINDRRL